MADLSANPVQLIPLNKAVLCENCKCVTESPNETCLACGSKSLVNLARLLEQKEAKTER